MRTHSLIHASVVTFMDFLLCAISRGVECFCVYVIFLIIAFRGWLAICCGVLIDRWCGSRIEVCDRMEGFDVAFKSQMESTKVSSRRGSASPLTVSQSYKQSTKAEELSFRISAKLLADIGLKNGDKADVLFDDETSRWMIRPSQDGFTISGKAEAPTGLIRYTLKVGHARLTNKRADLPVKKECDIDTLSISERSIIFALQQEGA